MTEKIRLYDKVRLVTGQVAYVVEIYSHGEVYEADIDDFDGTIRSDIIRHDQIDCILHRAEDT